MAEAGDPGWEAVEPSSGLKVYTQEPETAQLHRVEILGIVDWFDRMPIWHWRWLTGPRKGQEEKKYGRSFWIPINPKKRYRRNIAVSNKPRRRKGHNMAGNPKIRLGKLTDAEKQLMKTAIRGGGTMHGAQYAGLRSKGYLEGAAGGPYRWSKFGRNVARMVAGLVKRGKRIVGKRKVKLTRRKLKAVKITRRSVKGLRRHKVNRVARRAKRCA